jgi:hypothetical protein
MKRALSRFLAPAVLVLSVLAMAPAAPAAGLFPELVLPLPAPGSFVSTLTFLPDGRLIAFDGFTVYRQRHLLSSVLEPIGTLPAGFEGTTDPAFAVVSPDGRDIFLGAGAGGSQFGNPAFNGNIFRLSARGGEATLVAQFPFHVEATFRRPQELVFSQGETSGPLTGQVKLLDLRTQAVSLLVDGIPGAPSGVAFDRRGNLYAGLGFGQDPARTGEIRRFGRAAIRSALLTGIALDFDSDGELVVQVLSGSNLQFDLFGRLWVGGGDIIGPTGSFGFFAQVDPRTGQVLERFDPTDGDPDDQDVVFYFLAFTPVGCRIAAVDEFAFFGSGTPQVFQMNACRP